MGAMQFQVFISHTYVQTAFDTAVKQARYDYGHAGYTGTIAEKDGYTVVKSAPMRSNEAGEYLHDMFERDDSRLGKWEPACAVAVADDEGKHIGWTFFGYSPS